MRFGRRPLLPLSLIDSHRQCSRALVLLPSILFWGTGMSGFILPIPENKPTCRDAQSYRNGYANPDADLGSGVQAALT